MSPTSLPSRPRACAGTIEHAAPGRVAATVAAGMQGPDLLPDRTQSGTAPVGTFTFVLAG
jgi:hypothetical protein